MQINALVALVTFEEAREFLDLKNSDRDNVVRRLVNAVSSDCARYCGRELVYKESVIEYHDGDGKDAIIVRRPPIVKVTELIPDVNGSALTEGADDDFVIWNAKAGIIKLVNGSIFPIARHGVKITYDGGYSVAVDPDASLVPEDLKQSILEGIAFRYLEQEHKRFGVTSQSIGRQITSSYGTEEYGPHVLKVWDSYFLATF